MCLLMPRSSAMAGNQMAVAIGGAAWYRALTGNRAREGSRLRRNAHRLLQLAAVRVEVPVRAGHLAAAGLRVVQRNALRRSRQAQMGRNTQTAEELECRSAGTS